MTDVVEQPATNGLRVTRTIGYGSIRISLGRLADLKQAERIRYGNMVESDEISFPDQPLVLDGANLGDRKRQLRGWLISGGTNRQIAEAIAVKLRPKVNYVRYMDTVTGPALIVECKDT